MTTSDRELIITRTFDAPRSLVFKVWTDGEHLRHWSAPRDFTIPFGKMDFRPGGGYRTCLRSPEGKDYWLQGVYREIVEPERLVFTHAWEDANSRPGPETLVTVIFEEHNGKTKLSVKLAWNRLERAIPTKMAGLNALTVLPVTWLRFQIDF